MTRRTYQRICIKFCFNLGKSCTLFWPTFADNNTGKHWACATCDCRWSSMDCSWTRKWLRDAMRRKRPRFCSSGDWLLHHDNAPAHSSNLVQRFLTKHKIVQLRQTPYSPDIAPCDFWMFAKLKMAFKGKRFDDIETIQSNATRELKAIPKSTFEDCFQMWKHRWERVVQSNRDYLEEWHGPDDEE